MTEPSDNIPDRTRVARRRSALQLFIVSPPADTATVTPVAGYRESMSIARRRDRLRSESHVSQPQRSKSRRRRRIASIRRETALLATKGYLSVTDPTRLMPFILTVRAVAQRLRSDRSSFRTL